MHENTNSTCEKPTMESVRKLNTKTGPQLYFNNFQQFQLNVFLSKGNNLRY